MNTNNRFVKVRVEEIAIGAIVGIGTGIAATSPLTMGLPSLNPLAAGIGAAGFVQAGLLWGGAIAGGALGSWWAARQPRDSHVSGHVYYKDFAEAAKAMQPRQTSAFSQAQKDGRIHGINIGGVELARKQEARSIAIVGLQGAGKSALLTSVIDQVFERGDHVILHDPSGDFTKIYYDPKTTVLLGPWDERAAFWDAAADISDPALASEFGSAVAGTVDGANAFFYESAGRLIGGLIRSYMEEGKRWSWRDLWEPLVGDPVSLVQRAAAGNPLVKLSFASAFPPPGAKSGPKVEKSGLDVLSTLATKAEWLSQYAAVDRARPDAPRFSIVEWLQGTGHKNVRMVLLNTNARSEKAGHAIFGSILKTMVAVASSAEMRSRGPDEPGVWALMDEIPMMGAEAMQSITKLAALGRKKGVRVVLAEQDESQIPAELGDAKAKPITAVMGARIYLQCSEEVANAVSTRIGKRKLNRIETTSDNGALAGKTKKLVEEQAIAPSELTALDTRTEGSPQGVELILRIGNTLGRLLQPFAERHPDIADDFVPSEAWKFGTLARWQREHSIGRRAADIAGTRAAVALPADTPDDDHTFDDDSDINL